MKDIYYVGYSCTNYHSEKCGVNTLFRTNKCMYILWGNYKLINYPNFITQSVYYFPNYITLLFPYFPTSFSVGWGWDTTYYMSIPYGV